MKKIVFCMAATALLFAASCSYDNYSSMKPKVVIKPTNTPCDTTAMKYSVNVAPILAISCNVAGCHNSTDANSGVVLDTYKGVSKQISNGQLLPAINHSQPDGSGGIFWMPQSPGPALTACQINQITQWVNIGAPNN